VVDVVQPGWVIVGAAAAVVIWWLHRFHHQGDDRLVSAAFLWREQDSPSPRGHQLRPADRRWWLRALAALLLALALSRPLWPGGSERTADVWIDDSLSFATTGQGTPRAARAADILASALVDAGITSARVRSLATPGRSLDLALADVAGARESLLAWIRPEERPAQPPISAEMDSETEHWLVTDGADGSLAAWAATAPLARVVTVGTETENVAITRLAVRRALGSAAAQGLVEVVNTGRAPARRTVEVHAGQSLVHRAMTELAPGDRRIVAFALPAGQTPFIRAAFTRTDALAADDTLELDAGAVQLATVALDTGCSPDLSAALRVHPGVTLVTASAPSIDVRVLCGATEPVGVREPVLWFVSAPGVVPVSGTPAWSPIAGSLANLGLDAAWMRVHTAAIPDTGFVPVLASGEDVLVAVRQAPTRRVAVRIDPAAGTLAGRPEFAALIAGLLDLTAGRALLDEPAIASRPAEVSVIAPTSIDGGKPTGAPESKRTGISLAPIFLAGALMVLLWDTLSRRRRAGGSTAARVGVLALVAAALWNPTLPWGGRPLDLIVVLDDSRSTGGSGWDEAASAARSLPTDSRLGLIRYGANAAVEFRPTPIDDPTIRAALAESRPPRRLPVDGSFTNSETALMTALRLASPSRSTAILVVSDGVDTHGSIDRAITFAKRAGVDVYGQLIEPVTIAGDCRIDTVDAPDSARAGRQFRLHVSATCDRPREGKVVGLVDGQPAAEIDVKLDAGGPTVVAIDLASDQPGHRDLTTTLDVQGDPDAANNRWRSAITIDGSKPILMVTRDPQSAVLAQSLADAGRTMRTIHPRHLESGEGVAEGVGVVVLDDIAIGDAPESAWVALAESVERRGTGLVVLGGPRSFAAGGYRGSRLEDLLPVTAEPRGPAPRAAVLFLVDKSDSMERDHRGVSRLAHARHAVRVTSESLGGIDAAGLMWFDRGPGQAVPLMSKAAFMASVDDAWTVAPSGGTTLAPGLQAAIEQLGAAEADQRLLVLVTDGFTSPDEDLASMGQRLVDTGVSLIALVVSGNREVADLEALADINDGVLLRIDDVARLPSLMRAEVGTRRSAWRPGPVVPRPVAALPFLGAAEEWPPLEGLALTTLRPGARAYLQTDDGDPLLAEHRIGLARVVALPGGLGGWARRWLTWPRWGRFAGGLVAWTGTGVRSPLVGVTVQDQPEGIVIRLDAVDESFAWDVNASATTTVADPLGQTRSVRLDQTAPGRFEGVVPATQPGRHTWVVRIGNRSISGALVRGERSERAAARAPLAETRGGFDAAIPWSPEAVLRTSRNTAMTPIRSNLTICALVILIVLFAHERIGLGHAWSMIRPKAAAWIAGREPRKAGTHVR